MAAHGVARATEERHELRRFALSFAGRSKKRGQTKEIDLRGVLEAPLLPFSLQRQREKEKRSEVRRVRERREEEEEDSWHTQGDLERTFRGAFRLIILIYSRERNPTWPCPRRAYPVCRKQCNIVVVSNRFLALPQLLLLFLRSLLVFSWA